ncbi:MAG: YraN family protein [Tannerella sp.]|jgi:putative endonuclease|nr:YraN family protein [Tannerella sp.]
MAERNETGKQGERLACSYLEGKGYLILDVNWHFRHYELDIVASFGGEMVVVEVKTRSYDYLVAPELAVDMRKIRRLVIAADAYCRIKNVDMPVRFDIISVIKTGSSYKIVEHIDDAFYPPVTCRNSSSFAPYQKH